MYDLKNRIQADVKTVMRAQDKETLAVMRFLLAAIKQVEVDERVTVDDNRLLIILDKLVKQRKESISQFEAAGRADLVAKEQFELQILSNYLPIPLTSAELDKLLDTAFQHLKPTNISAMGSVMAYLKPLVQGRCDLAQISQRVKAYLSSL